MGDWFRELLENIFLAALVIGLVAGAVTVLLIWGLVALLT